VENRPPVANAGGDFTASPSSLVLLDGRASSDPDGDEIATWLWEQLAGDPVTLEGADTSGASFLAPPADGVLEFRLTVSDGLSESTDDV